METKNLAYIEGIYSENGWQVADVSKYEYEAAIRYGLPPENSILSTAYFRREGKKVKCPAYFSKETINLLFVGRFDPQKGVDYLLQAFAKCRRRDIHLYLIGDNVIGGAHIEKKDTGRLTFLKVPMKKLEIIMLTVMLSLCHSDGKHLALLQWKQ